jgi:hypothetical protein
MQDLPAYAAGRSHLKLKNETANALKGYGFKAVPQKIHP